MKINQRPEVDREKAKYYLDYLDKEMTFTGIITTFCVGALFFMIEKIFPKEVVDLAHTQKPPHTDFQNTYFIIPIVYLAVATLLLVWHRSRLAFHYGQISLEIYKEKFSVSFLNRWLIDVDTWPFWYFYFAVLIFIVCSFLMFAIFVFTTQFNPPSSGSIYSIWIFLRDHPVVCIISLTLIAVVIEVLHMHWLSKKYPSNSLDRVNKNS